MHKHLFHVWGKILPIFIIISFCSNLQLCLGKDNFVEIEKMEKNSECEQSRTLEEGIYWKHFKDIHFFLTLPPDFHHHLVLPEKFSAHMKDHLSDNVSLKGPSGVSWDIDLLKSDNLIFCGNGWKDFVKVNGLSENCLLVFKYQRNKMFEVLIIDQGSCCEKESTYFVRKCKYTKSDQEDREQMVARDTPTEILEDEGEEDSSIAASKKPIKDGAAGFCSEEENTPSLGKRSISNETVKEVSHTSRVDTITPENGENIAENDHSCESGSHSKKTVNGKQTTSGLSQISTEKINLENGQNSQAMDRDYSHFLKALSEKQPRGDVRDDMENKHIHVSQSNVIILEDENSLNEENTTKEIAQNSREIIAPKNGKKSSADHSGLLKGRFGKEHSKRTAKKVTRISYREVNRPNYREISPEEDHSSISRRKRNALYKRCPNEYLSKRRPVTELEKANALQRAYENQTENCFTAVMRPTYVYRKFYMNIPAEWLRKCRLQQNQEVVLRVGSKTWHTKFSRYRNNHSGFVTGWKRFALENCLEEFDVLVFKPVNQNSEAVVLDVDIFRVVATIVPPIPKNKTGLRRL